MYFRNLRQKIGAAIVLSDTHIVVSEAYDQVPRYIWGIFFVRVSLRGGAERAEPRAAVGGEQLGRDRAWFRALKFMQIRPPTPTRSSTTKSSHSPLMSMYSRTVDM